MAISSSSLDVNSIVTQLMQLEQRPLTLLASKEAGFQAKISAYGSIKSALAALQSTVAPLARSGTFSALTATSSDATVLTASASGVPTGTYNIEVLTTAKYHAF